MRVYEAIRSRVAVRDFKSDQVAEPIVRQILLAARWAPSQRNRQPWHFIVIKDRRTLQRIAALAPSGSYIGDAPIAIAVVMDGAKMGQFDSARAIQNMIMVAWDNGVGATYVGGIDREAVKKLLDVPEAMDLISVIPFGIPSDQALKAGKKRKDIKEITHSERFGRAYV